MQNTMEKTTDLQDKTPSESPSPTADRFAETAHDKVDQLAKVGGNAERKARGAAKQAGSKVDELSSEVTDTAGEAITTAKKSIEDNPLIAAGAAFAIGFVLSSLLRR